MSEGDTDVIVLDRDAPLRELKKGEKYLAQVNNVETYGVFVSLTPGFGDGSDISGLVHRSNLPPLVEPREFSVGDRCVVEVEQFKEDGDIAFIMNYAEGVESGSQGDIPQEEIIDVDKRATGQSAATKRAPGAEEQERQLADMQEKLDGLEQLVDQLIGDGQAEKNSAFDAVRTINRLRKEDYEVVKYQKTSKENGEVVDINLTFKTESSESDDK